MAHLARLINAWPARFGFYRLGCPAVRTFHCFSSQHATSPRVTYTAHGEVALPVTRNVSLAYQDTSTIFPLFSLPRGQPETGEEDNG